VEHYSRHEGVGSMPPITCLKFLKDITKLITPLMACGACMPRSEGIPLKKNFEIQPLGCHLHCMKL